MAKKTSSSSKPDKPQFTCKDCAHSYDWHEKEVNGEVFMCWCPFFKWARFLRHDYCNQFDKRKEDGKETKDNNV